jgi:carboxyl-terminal processing protease
MKNIRNKKQSLAIFLLPITIFLFSLASVFASIIGIPSSNKGTAAIPEIDNEPVKYSFLGQACELICEGKFDAADELFKHNPDVAAQQFGDASRQLSLIIEEYRDINKRMELAREKTYTERLASLDKLRTEADVNDVNDVVEILAAVAEVSELADKKQKEKLLSDKFVEDVLQKAVDKATDFEADGKWLEAYINCYAWLIVIDPNNEGYSDYAQQIYDKATIVASLEDSPCETTAERYEGVNRKIFIRTINYLDIYYVNRIDYKQMATKALERCRLLGEVMEFPPEDFKIVIENQRTSYGYKQSLSAWSVTLEGMLDEIEQDSVRMYKDRFLNLFEKILKLNETTVKLPKALLVTHFSEAALSALDSYTIIVWPRQVQEFEKLMTNEFSGIGIEISKPKGLLTVSSLLPDTPAYKSGLDAGDVIEKVDGIETKDMSLTCAVKKITGPKGTKVKLTVKRPGEEETNDIVITRGKIVVPTIRGWQRIETGQWKYMIDPENKIGYVRLTSFSAESSGDLEEVLDELEENGLKGLILDLRYNSGGLLESAIDVANKFIDEGLIVARQSGFGKLPVYAEAKKRGTHPNYPLVILVNSNSASASEIVAGALADKAHKRAILVGTRTHGKGSVQGVTNSIGDGAQLKYTMAYYHLPSGQRVESREEMKKQDRNDWGVGPNIVVDLNSEELKKMIDVQRANDVLVRADHDETQDDVKKYSIEETIEADLQLAIGLLVVRSKLIQAEALELARTDS